MQYYLAVDIGASSGRHILGHVENGRIVLEEIYRFDNNLIERNGHLCWDLPVLFGHIKAGLKACKSAGKVPVSMGIDTWAVDFVLLDQNGKLLSDTVAYRDKRTEGIKLPIEFAKLYEKTGIQYQSFNTIYQLAALQKEHPDQLKQADRFLMIPEYLGYLLTGKAQNEYTNATTTDLVNAHTKTWDTELLDAMHLPKHIFGTLAMPGIVLGCFTQNIHQDVGFDCTVILPATHDTGSAFLAVPARDEHAVYISSGTWSLLGVENKLPITTPESREANFTNEGGYSYRYRYLKNIMGLWIIQSIRRNINKRYSFAQLEQMARKSKFTGTIDVNDAHFLAPQNMLETVKAACDPAPENIGDVMRCVYQSLADSYAQAIQELQTLTGKTYTSINIVGGGSKDGYLNELTAKAAQLPVYAGPTEGTALGNLMVQMIAAGEYPDLQAARQAIKVSFPIKEVHI